MVNWVPPGLLLIAGALLVPFLKGKVRSAYVLALPLVALANVALMEPGNHWVLEFIGVELVLARVDSLSLVFGYVFAIFAFIGGLYSLGEGDGHFVAAYVYAGSALGAVFAGDLISFVVFWELMLPSSVMLVWFRGTRESIRSGFRYAVFHTFGGAILMSGLAIEVANGGPLAFDQFALNGAGPVLILVGFLVNAAVPPLHPWLTDAYPRSTVAGGVFMCAFTTKTAVYALARGFPGTEALIWMGAVMALYGVIFAMLENDIRGILSYHIVSQVGYMVAGIGIGTAMGVNGSSAHAFTHILYKGLLFMGAGSVIYATGASKLSELGGLHRRMRTTMLLYMVGAFSISALPLFSGFVSKSMVIAAASEEHLLTPWGLLTLSSVGTFLSVGLKLPYFTFFGEDSGIAPKRVPRHMVAAMGIAALANVLLGIYPDPLYRALPSEVEFVPYTAPHLMETLLIIATTAVAFYWTRELVKGKPKTVLDVDWTYRVGTGAFMWAVRNPVGSFAGFMEKKLYDSVDGVKAFSRAASSFDGRAVDGVVNFVPEKGIKRPSFFTRWSDDNVVDGVIDRVSVESFRLGDLSSRVQAGLVQGYVGLFALGIVVLAVIAGITGRWLL
ncbi:MAG: NADH-quinone oxidoreductase subunit L [Methanonatronarchaeales archaeon]|nr:NADH-quinone oxidoreductase subunit L [Methanonatronarchaeales archaeon]